MTIDCAIDIDSSLEEYVFEDTGIDAGQDFDVVDAQEFFDWEIDSADDWIYIAETVTEPYAEYDKLLTRTTPYHLRRHELLTPSKISGVQGLGRVAWSSDDESVCLVMQTGRVLHVDGGTATITGTCNGLDRTRAMDLPAIDHDYLVGGVEGTARKDASDAIDDRITLGGEKTIFSTQDHATPIYVRNTACWAYGLDLTCMSPWNTAQGTRGITMVSPRHFICADHNHITTGATARLITADNAVVEVVVANGLQIPSTDIWVGVLSADVPGSIGFAMVLPADYNRWFPVGNGPPTSDVPLFYSDQENKALVAVTSSVGSSCIIKEPVDAVRLSYYETVIPGDSGHGLFFIIDGQLVLLATFFQPTGGPFATYYHTEINAAMTTLGGGYQLTDIDLSSFAEFT